MHRTTAILAASALGLGATIIAVAGPLSPPAGPVASSYKTLSDVEPRIAINALNTPGDNDGSPSLFKITQPGSYYLTGDIVGVIGRHGIEIAASGVTIDLNGFDVRGVAGMGAFDGITVTVGFLSNIEVKNGSVRNWGEDGVDLYTFSSLDCLITSVRASGNGGNGVSAASDAILRECTASGNLGDGIVGQFGSVIIHCAAYANGGTGISTVQGSSVRDCAAYDNNGDGIAVGVGCGVTNCTASRNTRNGIVAINGCTVFLNTCAANGESGDGAGILLSGTDNRVEQNNCTTNDRGIDVNGGGNVIMKNTCSGNTINWDIAVGNAVGPIVGAATNAAVISGNTYTGSLGSTDPNANFTY